MLEATVRCSALWTQTSNEENGHIRPMCRCSLADQSFRQITCLCLHPVITHIHKSQWPTNLRLPAVLLCVPANRMVLLLTLRSMYRCQVHFMETYLYYLRAFLAFFPLSEQHPVLDCTLKCFAGYELMVSLWVGVLGQALIHLVWMSVACAKLFDFTGKGKMRGHCPTQT